ncbi:MAG: RdgB/HAM1 family non-canonical purine NTP pyrophosphatase [Euryarchaeota archaeon]|nr:RdgB/HAM1 family non-canonical purine NTP pyrophosphatase [Euryarchaeota archaeon]
MKEVALVTSNMHKLKEFRHGLAPLGYDVVHLPVDCDEIQADTLEEVVDRCLDDVVEMGHSNIILDDSGLFIDRLNGFPGVYSSYVFSTLGNEGILKLMDGSDDRRARFECCIGCQMDDVGRLVVKGSSPGRIIGEARGRLGFGYDPIFVPDGSERTFAEMGLDEKNALSHRGNAMRLFVNALSSKMKVD